MQRKLFVLLVFLVFAPFASAVSAPQVSSSTHPDHDSWYSEDAPQFSWENVSGATKYRYKLDSTPDTTPDEGSTETDANHATMPHKMDGEHYFHIQAYGSGEWSVTTHYKILIDAIKPHAVQNLTAEVNLEGNVTLTWEEPYDKYSGVEKYTIYRSWEKDFDIRSPNVLLATDVTETTYLDSNSLSEGRYYFYLVVAHDFAGNQGTVGIQAFAKMPTSCDLEITLDSAATTNQSPFEISISSDSTIYSAKLDIVAPDGNTVRLVERQDATELSATYTPEAEGKYTLMLYGTDTLLGDSCDTNFTIKYDATPPEVELLALTENQKLTGQFLLQATASDTGTFKAGLNALTYYYRDANNLVEITTISAADDNFNYDWNTLTAPNGRYFIKVVAYDFAGNKAEQEVKVTVENKDIAKTQAKVLLGEADVLKEELASIDSNLSLMNIHSDDFKILKQQADSNLSQANVLFEQEYYTSAEQYATEAKKTYDAAKNWVDFNTYHSSNYVYNPEQLDTAFAAAGLVSSLYNEARTLIKSYTVERHLEILKVRDGNSDYYLANVVVAFTNTDSNTVVYIQIVEVIPKDFASSASEIISDKNFVVIRDDPVIQFVIGKIGPNRTVERSYALASKISKDKADVMIADNMINTFSSPPIILLSETEISEESFSATALGFDLGSLFNFGGDNSLLFIGIIVVVVLVIVIVLLVVVILALSRRKGGEAKQTKLAYEPQSKPLFGFLKK